MKNTAAAEVLKQQLEWKESNIKADLNEVLRMMKDKVETMEEYSNEENTTMQIDILHSIMQYAQQRYEWLSKCNAERETFKEALLFVEKLND